MPGRSKGARLWLRKRRGRAAQWVIRDGNYQKGTSCAAHDIVGAERSLAAYIASKHVRGLRRGTRDPEQIPIADVLTVYLTDVVRGHSRPKETKGRIARLDSFFGDRMLSYVTGETCRAYVAQRSSDAAARRELEDLRAAINHHRREGLCNKVVEVALPSERQPRERWLTRSEAARLIWSAWRYREVQKGKQTESPVPPACRAFRIGGTVHRHAGERGMRRRSSSYRWAWLGRSKPRSVLPSRCGTP